MSLDESHIPLDALVEEIDWRKCVPRRTAGMSPTAWFEVQAQAFFYFCENFWYIRHPEKGRILFKLYDSQKETVRAWLSCRMSIVLKARQIGFSTLVAAFAFWLAFFHSDRAIIMLSRTERDAIKLLQKAKYGARFLPEWMLHRPGSPLMNETQTKIEFTNESVIESLPSSQPARGDTAYLIVVDELAFLPNSEEAWTAVEPAADVGGRIIALSTANGEGNLFHSLWVGATTGTNGFKPLFFPWSANGRSDEWYETKKATLPDYLLAQEYPDNADEAFLRSGNPVFNLDTLRAIETRKPVARGFLALGRNVPTFVAGIEGDNTYPLKVWEYPQSDGRYAIGADPAQGMEHGDFSSAHVINVRNGHVVAHWHGRIDPDLFGVDVLAWLGLWYNQALVGVENNNHGLTTLKALQLTAKYHPIYYQRSPQYKRSVPTDVLGWRTTQITKPLAIDELNRSLREGALHLWDAETVAELRTFVRDGKGKMSGSPFDDRVMSLAIANQMTKYVWLPEFTPETEPGPGTFGYFEKLLFGELDAPKRKVREPIGQHYVRTR